LSPVTVNSFQNTSSSNETNYSENSDITIHVLENSSQDISSTVEVNKINKCHSSVRQGTAEIQIPTRTNSGETGTDFENGSGKTVPIQNMSVDITAKSSAVSSSPLEINLTIVNSNDSSNMTVAETLSLFMSKLSTQNTLSNMEGDASDDSYSTNCTSVYEPGAANVSVVVEANSTHTDDNFITSPSINNISTTEASGCSRPCNGEDQYGYSWTGCPGFYVSRPCPNRALGEAKWFCDSYGNSFVGDIPDYSNCTHMWIEEVQEEVSYKQLRECIQKFQD
jgi:hypothetical protein